MLIYVDAVVLSQGCHMLRALMYTGLVVAIVGALWTYAEQLGAPSQRVLQPNYPSLAMADVCPVADVAPWSMGDVESLSS
jgi:hypothetical protein